MKKSKAAKTESASRRATYQDVLDAPAHMIAEIIDGKLCLRPRLAPLRARAGAELMGFLSPPIHRRRNRSGGWWIFFEPELHLGGVTVVPDTVGWRRERMPELPSTDYFTLAPDWVCEVLSPSTRKLDRGPKREFYARVGVSYLWLVDPSARSLEAFELRGTELVLTDTLFDRAPVSLTPFEAVDFDLDDLWWLPSAVHNEPSGEPTAESERELTRTSAST